MLEEVDSLKLAPWVSKSICFVNSRNTEIAIKMIVNKTLMATKIIVGFSYWVFALRMWNSSEQKCERIRTKSVVQNTPALEQVRFEHP